MQNPVTPWTATVKSDIDNTSPVSETVLESYTLKLYNTGDSLWLTVKCPSAGRLAFRLCFGMNSSFESVAIIKLGDGMLVTASTRLGNYRITIAFPDPEKAMFRYTTTFRASFPILIPFWPRDIVPLVNEGRIENTGGVVHTHQVGTRSGQLFFSMTKPKNGSVFYFQNLSAMSAYCDACQTSVAETVGGAWPEIGFQFPINTEKPLPADKEFVISDAFVILSESIPEKDCEIAEQFLDHLATVYKVMPRPQTQYRDWPGIAKKALRDLYANKGCWTQTNSIPYLNAYVADYKTPAEIMVQLAVLLPLREYLDWLGKKHVLYKDLSNGLRQFYDGNINSIVRWHPSLEDELDKSEEQKKEMVMDSWYLHHPLLNLARLALKGDTVAKQLFLDSIDYAIKVAHHFKYQWPVFYKMTTLEVLKAETEPGNGGEKDVPGSYLHIMLMAYRLTGEKRFLNEAVKAARSLDGLGLDIFYQANNTAFSAGALLELYKETSDKRYLELSYCCLAGIFKNVQLLECDYGNKKEFPNFFAVFPLNDAPYTAAYEELEVYAGLHHFMLVSEGIAILPSLRILIPEFIKYTLNRLPFYYPPMLPEGIIAEDIKTGEVQKDLWIPLEDIHDGWEPHGQVGQEVYGAGLPFGIVSRQYHEIKHVGIILFIDYPIAGWSQSGNGLTFNILGDARLQALIKIVKAGKSSLKVNIEYMIKSRYQPALPGSNSTEFIVPAGSKIRIKW